MKDGILNIYKPEGMTSHDVVGVLRRLLGTKKIGHTGTLDPMATGVLPVCIGRATRITEYLDMDFKTYRCTMRLGILTDTQDIWGQVLEQQDTNNVTEDAVRKAFERFHGVVEQTPPMYSAVRVDGKRLYEYARAGETVEVRSRKIFIRSLIIDAVDFSFDGDCKKVTFTVECSKGTYIRTICQDIGEMLGCGAAMESLCRLSSGRFCLEDAIDLNWLIENYGAPTFREDGRRIISTADESGLDAIERMMKTVDFPLENFGKVLVNRETGRKFIDGWHIGMKECKVLARPVYEEKMPVLPIREEYKRAYNIYKEDAESADGMLFLGVAFFSEKYKKLVADKVFSQER